MTMFSQQNDRYVRRSLYSAHTDLLITNARPIKTAHGGYNFICQLCMRQHLKRTNEIVVCSDTNGLLKSYQILSLDSLHFLFHVTAGTKEEEHQHLHVPLGEVILCHINSGCYRMYHLCFKDIVYQFL